MLVNKVGTFFILVGLFLIFLFVLSDMAQATTCGYLIYGVVSLGLGIYLWTRNPPGAPKPSGRFRLLKMLDKKPPKK